MRNSSLVRICGLLLLATACGDSSPEAGGEIQSQEDVRQLFEAIVPELTQAFTQLASQQSLAEKTSHTVDIQCPQGGTLSMDLSTGQATLTDCTVQGISISGSLALFVTPPPPLYIANFNGTLMISGTFSGTVVVNSALFQWTDPPSAGTTFWDVTVTVGGQTFTVSSLDAGPVCPVVEVAEPGPPGAACDDGSDCLANSCRDPVTNPSEGCTCRNVDGGGSSGSCEGCIGINVAPLGLPADPVTSCGDSVDFSCTCTNEAGEEFFLSLSSMGCIF